MTYKELQNQLKTFKSQGLTTIALNAKKAILQAEYDRLMNATVKETVNCKSEQSQDYSQDYVDIYSRTASKNEDIALTDLIQVSIDPIEDIAAAAKNLSNEIAQDYADLCHRIACEIEDIEQSDSIKYPSISEYDPEQSVDYFGFLDEETSETINAIEVKETFKSISKEADPQAREKIFDALAKLLTIFLSSLIKVTLFKRRLFNRISQWVCQIRLAFQTDRLHFKREVVNISNVDLKAFAHWYFSGFAIPQFA